jgi:uncharacterized protein
LSPVSDRPVLEAQIGRPLRAESAVGARCHLGLPVVAVVPPVLDDGTPFPTRYWLSCPLAQARVGRLEAAGGVRRMDARSVADRPFGERLAAAHARYRAERDAAVPENAVHVPTGGVAGSMPGGSAGSVAGGAAGGIAGGVKCLHAHYADHAAGNDNPVGEAVAPWVEPLDCVVPCVVDGARNPAWSEPR